MAGRYSVPAETRRAILAAVRRGMASLASPAEEIADPPSPSPGLLDLLSAPPIAPYNEVCLSRIASWPRDPRIHRFPPLSRETLRRQLGCEEKLRQVEALCYVFALEDAGFHARLNEDVRKLLRKQGEPARKGKRPAAQLSNLVDVVTPLLLAFGVPFKTGESSRLVLILSEIAVAIGVQADPRNELRRLSREANWQVRSAGRKHNPRP